MTKIQRLPQPDKNYHLSDEGYKLSASKVSRHKALKEGSKKFGTLTVLKRLNLVRNLTKKGSKNKSKLGEDVEFMKMLYKKEKKGSKKASKKGTKQNNKKKGTKKGSKRGSKRS